MPDCSTCVAFPASSKGTVVPCPKAGAKAYVGAVSTGIKQHPLLYLMYNHVPGLAARGGRKVRATWLSPVINKNGTKRYNWTNISEKRATTEVQEMVGMLLAQRVWTLPLWALQQRSEQEALALFLQQLLYAGDEALANGDSYVPVDSLWKQFRGVESAGERSLAARGVVERIRERMVLLEALSKDQGAYRQYLDARFGEQIRQHEASAAATEQKARQVLAGQEGFDAYRQTEFNRLQIERNQEAQRPEAAPGDKAIRMSGFDADLETLNALTPEQFHMQAEEEMRGFRDMAQTLRDMTRRMDPEPLRQEHAECVRLLQAWQAQGEAHRAEEITAAAKHRLEILGSALENDFALQKGNYDAAYRPFVDGLKAALENPVAAYVFLSLHPKLKYEWTAPTLCRMTKLLSDAEFLAIWKMLHDKNLIFPGPHARLGVAVMNALTPGSYDQRHRELIQWELDDLVTAMREFGLGDVVTCHSCGATEFGDPDKSGWIRDHNPPTALADLYYDDKIDLGLPFYADTQQILLPQCMACSTAQSSIVNKVVTILKGAKLKGKTPAEVRAYALSALTLDERGAFARLVLNPGIGWSSQSQGGKEVKLDPVSGRADVLWDFSWWEDMGLVTSGTTGSFAGLDNDLLEKYGNHYGCHTCVDVGVQTNAYRGISWIADHQPPTSLVERGLAELPQIVHPHCHKCSKLQSQLTRKLVGLFDGCFGKGWPGKWIETVKELGSNDVA